MSKAVPTTYSASCLPPKDVLNHIHGNTIQRYNIKFPTFFGRSVGFIKLNDSWKSAYGNQKCPKTLQTAARIGSTINQTKFRISGSNDNSKHISNLSTDDFKCYGGRHDNSQCRTTKDNLDKQMERDYKNFHRKVSCSAYPLSFHPRNHSRSQSLPKQIQSESIDLSKLYSIVESETNCNNCLIGRKEPEWIELFFEFPNGIRQRFHIRYQAIFKNALRAFSARMGYKSINDLVFITSRNKSIFINDTPKSIGLMEGDVIRVSNLNFQS